MRIFIEEQKFNQPLILVGLAVAFTFVGFSTYSNWAVISEGSTSEKIGALSGILIITLVSLLFLKMKLKTKINEIGVHYQFYPFNFSYKTISWATINKCYVRKYNAISEFGGWGLKLSFFGKNGKSLTTKGNTGLQIVLKNGKKVLIGTQKHEVLQQTIENYKDKINSKTN